MKKFLIILFFLITLFCVFIIIQVKINHKSYENKNQITKRVNTKSQDLEKFLSGPLMRDEDNKIGGITLDSKMDEILKVFGKPIKKQRSKIEHYDDIGTVCHELWIYNDLTITLIIRVDDKSNRSLENYHWIDKIYIYDGNYKTRRGIKIGDPIEKVIVKYGNNENAEIESTNEDPRSIQTKKYSNDYFYIKFGFENGKVFYIDIGAVYLG